MAKLRLVKSRSSGKGKPPDLPDLAARVEELEQRLEEIDKIIGMLGEGLLRIAKRRGKSK